MNPVDRLKFEFKKGNSAIRQIILINGGVFIFTLIVNLITFMADVPADVFLKYFYLPANLSDLMIRPWTLVTNMFFHSSTSFMHIVGNMIILYFIGRILQDYLNRSQVWKIFLGGGLLGGIFFVAAANVLPVFADRAAYLVLLGASGGVTAIVVATGFHLPFYVVRLFGVYSVQMRWLAVFLVLFDILTMPSRGNAGGLVAHIGGAVFGMMYILNLQGKLSLAGLGMSLPKRESKMKTVHHDESKRTIKKPPKPDQVQIDAILDKISHSGYNSLTKEEKEILFKASK